MEHIIKVERKIGDWEAVKEAVSLADRQGDTVVLTNGCFDILHPGHIAKLEQARALGDLLIVSLDEDAAVRAVKGEGRPLAPLTDRAVLVAALDCVDIVTSHSNIKALMSLIRPDIWAARANAPEDEIAAAHALGIQTVFIRRHGEWSTTGIIQRIKSKEFAKIIQ